MANVTATVSRANTSVDIPVLSPGGDPLVSRDVGKPRLKTHAIGREDPKTSDHYSASDVFTVTGILHGTNAYSDAQTLAEDLIKVRSTDGTPLTLDLSDLPSRSTYDVAAAGDGACRLTYAPGKRKMVGVQLSLPIVSETRSAGDQTQRATLSPDSGDGIKIERNGTSVTLSKEETVVREVGRPGINIKPTPGSDLPILFDRNEPASDVFEISGALVSSTSESDSNTLEETIVRQRLGTDALRLHFLDNVLGLDSYDVVAATSQGVRTSFSAGETGVVRIPKLTLQVVNNT